MKIQLQRQHRKYEKSKSTGIPWISEVPEEWEVKKLKYATRIYNGATPSSSIESYWDGDIDWYTPADIDKSKKYLTRPKRTITNEGYKSCGTHLVRGNSIIVSNRAPIGLIAMSKKPFCANQGCKSLEVKNNYSPDFLYYFLSAHSEVLDSLGNGSTFKELSSTALAEFFTSIPPEVEQNTIANYLDEKTALLDQIIASKRKQIELLKEKRNSLINRAVMRGLDENVEMKDSGVEWIGEVPMNWKLERLKFIAPLRNKKTGTASHKLTYIALENIESWTGGLINISDGAKFESIVNEFEKGDVLFGKLRPYLAKVVTANFKGVCTGELLVLEPKKFLQKFLFYRLISIAFIDIVNTSTYGAKMPRASWNFIGNLPIAYPNLEEQQKIAIFLDLETQNIDQTIALTEKSITLLEEYKTSLISNVVTGKVKI